MKKQSLLLICALIGGAFMVSCNQKQAATEDESVKIDKKIYLQLYSVRDDINSDFKGTGKSGRNRVHVSKQQDMPTVNFTVWNLRNSKVKASVWKFSPRMPEDLRKCCPNQLGRSMGMVG